MLLTYFFNARVTCFLCSLTKDSIIGSINEGPSVQSDTQSWQKARKIEVAKYELSSLNDDLSENTRLYLAR